MNASEIIDALGGTGETARLCEVSASAVSQWRENGIPRPWRKFLMASHPDVFARFEPVGAAGGEQKDFERRANDRRQG